MMTIFTHIKNQQPHIYEATDFYDSTIRRQIKL